MLGTRWCTFFLITVLSNDIVSVTVETIKLKVKDTSTAIQRHPCKECGLHMFGSIENADHLFYSLDFVHTELHVDNGWSGAEIAA